MKIGYLPLFIVTVLVGLLPVGIFNSLIDSLWHFKGNQLTQQNFPFDDRLSKTNLLLKTYKTANYNCIVLGSSRSILMRPDYLRRDGDRCFNYSVHGGRAEEYIVYAQFIRSLGIIPERVYVAIDGFNFKSKIRSRGRKTQDNIIKNRQIIFPEPVHRTYLSWDIFRFNYRNIIEKRERSRQFYDTTFQGRIRKSLPDYKPEFKDDWKSLTCNIQKYQYYASLNIIFREATIIGYVPPISSWKMFNDFYTRNMVNCVLQNIGNIAKAYDHVYDFSMPSPITNNPIHTYDGSHFDLPTQRDIADVLLDQPKQRENPFGYRVEGQRIDTYQKEFHGQMEKFLGNIQRNDLWTQYLDMPEERTASTLKRP